MLKILTCLTQWGGGMCVCVYGCPSTYILYRNAVRQDYGRYLLHTAEIDKEQWEFIVMRYSTSIIHALT